jgi:N-formylglutamate amidohydrolase
MFLYHLHRGNSPLIVDVPHAGTHVPDAIALRLSPPARALPDTDWNVDRLYAFVRDADATIMTATHSRYVVDLNRDPSGAILYPGLDNTEICPTRRFDNGPVYRDGEAPQGAEIAARVATFFVPYHAVLAAEIERVRACNGYAVVLDGHSILSVVPRFFDGRLPDLSLGTADGASCARELAMLAESTLAEGRFTRVVNGRFKGGYITRRYGRPSERIHALQLEMTIACYADEDAPHRYDAMRAAALERVLQKLVVRLAKWRPTVGAPS